MRIAIYSRLLRNECLPSVVKLVSLFQHKGAEVILHVTLFNQIKKLLKKNLTCKVYDQNLAQEPIELMISIGGDGTLLDTITLLKNREIPVLGINTGRLGFLANAPFENFETIASNIMLQRFLLEKRTLIEFKSNVDLFGTDIWALNDFVIHKKESSSMITINTFLNGEFLNTYWADGLIVSTPTGSTGYSLSCGGPIIFPHSANLVITPIAPHNLNVRPIVVSDDDVISFEVEGRVNSFLASLDSRSVPFESHIEMAVKRAGHNFILVRFNEDNFLNTLRDKLSWGNDSRNS
ncbi:MAG: NAD kinase [Bacteroidetes bacterium]|nr:NAD kinase [Bacteroidota bacterium]